MDLGSIKGAAGVLQTTSSGPASSVRYVLPDGRVGVRGIPLPTLPTIALEEPDLSPEYKAFVRLRSDWVLKCLNAGARIFDCRMALEDVGHRVTDRTLQKCHDDYVRWLRAGKPEDEGDIAPSLVASAEPEERLPNASQAAMDVVELMVAQVMEEHEKTIKLEIEALRPNAEKWRKLKALRDLLPE